MIVQQLNESLPDHSSRAKNANPASFHLLRITRRYDSVTRASAER
jgi:hypothetical protein